MIGEPQKLLFLPARTSARDDVTLASGRTIVHCLQPNGSQLAYMADGGTMSDQEWDEYCANVSLRAIRWPKAAKVYPLHDDTNENAL